MTRYLMTEDDRKICDEFGAFLERATSGDVWSLSVSKIITVHNISVSAQDRHSVFAPEYTGEKRSLSEAIAISLNQLYAGNPTPEERKAERLKWLKAEIESLEENNHD